MGSALTDECRADGIRRREQFADETGMSVTAGAGDERLAKMQRAEKHGRKCREGGRKPLTEMQQVESTGPSSSSSSTSARRNHGEKAMNPRKKNGDGGKKDRDRRRRSEDRQQIQDRVLELRQIVPSSTNCSIDALLEKTIEYIHFLQSTITADCNSDEGDNVEDDGDGRQRIDAKDPAVLWSRYDDHRRKEESMARNGNMVADAYMDTSWSRYSHHRRKEETTMATKTVGTDNRSGSTDPWRQKLDQMSETPVPEAGVLPQETKGCQMRILRGAMERKMMVCDQQPMKLCASLK